MVLLQLFTSILFNFLNILVLWRTLRDSYQFNNKDFKTVVNLSLIQALIKLLYF